MQIYKKSLEIFSTSRAIRHFERRAGLQPDVISVGEFFERFARFERPRASAAKRSFFMHKAAESARAKLHLSEDFLRFCKDLEYLFAFYEELSSQGVSIEQLKSADTNSFFDEYLLVLEQVQRNYLALLDEAGLDDEISCARLLPNDYLLGQYGEITLHLDGFLKRAEMDFLRQIPGLKLRVTVSRYNQALLKKCLNAHLEAGFCYELALCVGGVTEVAKTPINERKSLYAAGFKSANLQYLYALAAAAREVRRGVAPEDVVIIMCDEGGASALKALDVGNFCNFARGFRDVGFEQKLASLMAREGYELAMENVFKRLALGDLAGDSGGGEASPDDPQNPQPAEELATASAAENQGRLKRVTTASTDAEPEVSATLSRGEFAGCEEKSRVDRPLEVIERDFSDAPAKSPVRASGNKRELTDEDLLALATDAHAAEQLAEQLAELAELNEFLPLSFSDKINLLKPIRTAHVGGGSISVLGALESRSIAPKSVIVVDFNDHCVPARAKAQMYLNDALRRRAGLISAHERENLQRHYYAALFAQAERVQVFYVDNDERKPARFLRHFECLPLKFDASSMLKAYDAAIAKKPTQPANAEPLADWPESAKNHNFTAEKLSFTRLNVLNTSGAEYYFKYILNIPEPRPLEINAAQVGNQVHNLLETAPFEASDEEFLAHFGPALLALDALSAKIFTRSLLAAKAFFAAQLYEHQREVKISAKVGSAELYGVIDALLPTAVIDYKNSASINSDAHAEQLAFYALILANGAQTANSAQTTDGEKLADTPQTANGEPIPLDHAEELRAFNIYLKSTSAVIVERKDLAKNQAKILSAIAEYQKSVQNAAWQASKARGYYKLLATKEA